MKLKLSEGDLVKAIMDAMESIDADAFAKLAGDLLGGECHVIDYSGMLGGELQYEFTPDENYGGAFDNRPDEAEEDWNMP